MISAVLLFFIYGFIGPNLFIIPFALILGLAANLWRVFPQRRLCFFFCFVFFILVALK